MSQNTGRRPGVQSGLFLPLFDELADQLAVARLAAEAEHAGWDGFFVWDHLRWRPPVVKIADPWITLAAAAAAPSACGSARWSRRSLDGGPPSSPEKPPRWSCSAPAGWCSASDWAATGSATSSRHR